MDDRDIQSFLLGLFFGLTLILGGMVYYLYDHPVKEVQYIDRPVLVPVPKFIVPNSPGVAPIIPEEK